MPLDPLSSAHASHPAFGRRNAPRKVTERPVPVTLSPEQAAIFAAARQEVADLDGTRPRLVPRSFLAALLAGLCVGFGLAGLDVTRAGDTLRTLSGAGVDSEARSRLLPVILLLGLAGGARAAATNLLVAHWALRKIGVSHHVAYAAAGAAVAGLVAMAATAAVQAGVVDPAHLPTHGWAIDVVAGAAAGFLYRVFAGSRPA